MPLLHTSIPNLAQGVSQQPDNLRYPGQCDEQINAWSTVVEGLVKRPNSRLLNQVNAQLGTDVTAELFTHHVDRDEQNKYVITYDRGNGLQAFDLEDGGPMTITVEDAAAEAYLSVSSGDFNPVKDLRALTIADSTFIVNKKKTVERRTDTFYKTKDLELDALIFVKLGDYEKDYNIYIDNQLVPNDGGVTAYNPGNTTYRSGDASTGSHGGPEQVDTGFIAAGLKTALDAYFSTAINLSSVTISGGGGWADTGGNWQTGVAYSYEFKVEQYDATTEALTATGASGLLEFEGGTVSRLDYTKKGSNYVASTTANTNTKYIITQIRHWQEDSGVFKSHDEVWEKYESSVTLDSSGSVITTGTFAPVNPLGYTFPQTLSIGVAGDLTGLSTIRRGSVLKVSSSNNDFAIRGEDGLGNQALSVIYKEVDNITDLPKSCFNRFRVKVRGDADLDQDDYYVRFKTKDDEEFGEGSWIETAGWEHDVRTASLSKGIDSALDNTTMPVRLIPSPDTGKITSFRLEIINWNIRQAGDENTNPFPTFVSRDGDVVLYSGSTYTCIKTHTSSSSILPTNTSYWKAVTNVNTNNGWIEGASYRRGKNTNINDIFFFKNRLGILTEDSVVFSEADEYFNFFRTTTQSLLDSAPIDVGISHTKISILQHAQAFQEKLMLFSPKTQFVLRGGDLLTPKTVTISPVTEYDVSETIRPLALSNYIYFNFKRNNFEGLLEYTVDNNTETYRAAEITEQINKYIPTNIVRMEGSAAENMVIVQSDSDYKKLYVYKYFWQGNEKIQSAWMTFSFAKEIRSFYFIESTLYVITTDSKGTYIETIPMENGLVEDDKNYSLLLDHRIPGNSSYLTFLGWYVNDFVTINGQSISNATEIGTQSGFEFQDGMSFYTKNGNKRELIIDTDPASVDEFGNSRTYKRAVVKGLNADFVSYGADPVQVGNIKYICTQTHTSDAAKQPGTGADWQEYWRVITTTQSADAWSSGQSYTEETLYVCTQGHVSTDANKPPPPADIGTSVEWGLAGAFASAAPLWQEGYEYLDYNDFFIGYEYDMLYRFSKQNLKQPTERGGRSASDYTFQTIRNGSLEYSETGHFTVEVTPKFRDTYTYTYNPTLLASVSTLSKFTPETGFFKFAVQAQPNDATIEVKSSSALPCKLLAAEFESTMIPRSRRYGS